MYHKWKHKVTTDWFCNFLRNLHWALKMTTDWFWNFLGNQHLSQMRTQSHYIVFSVFLETSTKPPTQSTVWFIFFLQNLNQDFSIFFWNQGHYRLVLQFSWKSTLNTENDYRLVSKFSWKSTFGTLSTPNHYKFVFQFSWKPAPSHRQSLQFGL